MRAKLSRHCVDIGHLVLCEFGLYVDGSPFVFEGLK
jgi:hypothetical protein